MKWIRSGARPAKLILLAIAFCLVNPLAKCPADDRGFREFSQQEVPTPDQLFRALSLIQANHPDGGSEALTKQLEEASRAFLSNLSPEQREQLLKQFMNQRGDQPNPLPSIDAANQLSEFIRDNPGLRDALPQGNELLKEMLNRPIADGTAGAEPNGSDKKSDVGASPKSGPVGAEKRNSKTPFRDSNSERPLPGESNPKSSEPINNDRTQPAPNGRPSATEGSTPERSRPKMNPGEYAGTKFDRILVEAARRAMQQDGKSSPESKIGASVNSVFKTLVTDLHESITSRHPNLQSRLNTSLEQANQQTDVNSDRFRNWISSIDWQIPSTSMFERGINWTLVAMVGLLLGIPLIGWYLWTRLGVRASTPGTGLRRRFRVTKIRTAEDLVSAVDGFLVASFGAAAVWWHAGYAQSVMVKRSPELASQIFYLLNNYEIARYSGDPRALNDRALSRSAGILVRLLADRSFDSEPREDRRDSPTQTSSDLPLDNSATPSDEN